jgi:hypothetical protein
MIGWIRGVPIFLSAIGARLVALCLRASYSRQLCITVTHPVSRLLDPSRVWCRSSRNRGGFGRAC